MKISIATMDLVPNINAKSSFSIGPSLNYLPVFQAFKICITKANPGKKETPAHIHLIIIYHALEFIVRNCTVLKDC